LAVGQSHYGFLFLFGRSAQKRSHERCMELIFIACFVLVVICFLLIYNKIRNLKLLNTVTRSDRGTKSERDLVLRLLKMGIPSDMIFHDLYLQKHKGTFSQIDIVILTNVGIVVFEIKDYSGWIFGNGNYAQWTQVLAYGRSKYSFYNPIMQNKKHI